VTVPPFGETAAVVGELGPDLMVTRHQFRCRTNDELLHAEQVVDELRPALREEKRPAAEPAALGDDHPVGRPWVGVSIDAVTLNDRFLTSMTLPSLRRFMPGNNTWVVPVISWGRPAMVAFSRSKRRSSIGSTL
jgi:hypothetical protein